MAFKILNIKNDFGYLRQAKEDSEEFLKSGNLGNYEKILEEMEMVL